MQRTYRNCMKRSCYSAASQYSRRVAEIYCREAKFFVIPFFEFLNFVLDGASMHNYFSSLCRMYLSQISQPVGKMDWHFVLCCIILHLIKFHLMIFRLKDQRRILKWPLPLPRKSRLYSS